jgi:hypothetical protein
VLDGTSAVYAEVLPGVDLRVNVTPESFQPVFVVKTPQAAANEELARLTFDLTTQGLDVREGAAGNLAAVDGNGVTVFKAPPARMWDSAGDASGAGPQLVTVQATASGEGDPSDPSETTSSGSGLEPGQGDTVVRMDIEVSADTLAVVPDQQMLTRSDPAAFPLFIDPTVTWGESERTLLRSDGYESYGWGNGDDNQGKGSGKCGTWNGYYCGPGYVQKLYFEFAPDSLKGKQVLDATFRVTEPWAFQCDSRLVDLVRTNNISSSTTWSTRPAELDWMVDRWVSAGRGSLCDPDSPDAPIEFNDNPDEANENLTPTVRDFAAGKFSRLTLEIRAHDETDASAWKRFRNDGTLAVDFVGLPDKPTGVGLASGKTQVCSTSETNPTITGSVNPVLAATTQTKPGGESGAQLRVYFDLDTKSGTSWPDTPAGAGDLRPSTGYVGDNVRTTIQWAPNLADKTLYRYRAWVRSYYNGGSSYLEGPTSAATGYCYFRIDTTRPNPPQVTLGSPYTACTTSCTAGGGPGVPMKVTAAPAAGDTNIVGYEYMLHPENTISGTTGSSAVITPTRQGLHQLYVRAKDNADGGRFGAWHMVEFDVAPAPPVGQWHFAESTGAAVDSAGAASNATLSAGAVRDDHGRRGEITRTPDGGVLQTPVTDKGLALNGSTGYAATSGPVVDTSTSWTVSAWARLNSAASGNRTVLAQDGAHNSAFYLSYQSSLGTWTLRTATKDASDGNVSDQTVIAKQPAVPGAWTHLAAVYDASAHTISLYVNGRLQGSDTVAAAWRAGGALQMGRALWQDAYYDYFPGQIDEVTIWPGALPADMIADEVKLALNDTYNHVELVADWSADQRSGTTLPDSLSGYNRTLSLLGDAKLENNAIVLDGAGDAATTPGPVVDDTGSFTVTALVALDKNLLVAKPAGYVAQVLGQRTATGSAWGLWFQLEKVTDKRNPDTDVVEKVPEGYWYFGRYANGTFDGVRSSGVAEVDTDVRLTGIYDAQNGQISLYLEDDPNDAQPFTAVAGSGEFAVGTGWTNSTWQHYLPGRVSEVRLWAGALGGSDQVSEVLKASQAADG